MILEEYLDKNLLTQSKKVNRVDISFDLYQKICVFSVIKSEIRRKFFGIQDKKDPMEPHSICTVMNDEQFEHFFGSKKITFKPELFQKIDYYDDVCPGQRGFGRNIDRLCNKLIKFYHKKFAAQADETMKKIAKMHEQIDNGEVPKTPAN